MAASAQNLLLKGLRALAGLGRRFCAKSKELSVFAKFLLVISEKLSTQQKLKILFLITQVGLVKFSSGSNPLMQRNLAICSDNQKILKCKISRRMVSKTPFESPVRSTVKGSIENTFTELRFEAVIPS